MADDLTPQVVLQAVASFDTNEKLVDELTKLLRSCGSKIHSIRLDQTQKDDSMPIIRHRQRVWFGPPGVGKSTYVASVRGFDLETLPNTHERRLWLKRPEAHTYADIGAADLQPSDFNPRDYERILVLPARPIYDSRRATRDALRPEKASQADVYDGFSADRSSFDKVVADFPTTPVQVPRILR